VESREEKWAKAEAALRELLDRVRGRLDDENIRDIEDFIENREYEIALDWLTGVCETKSIVLDEKSLQIVESLDRQMGR
jgi:hypothetical protein